VKGGQVLFGQKVLLKLQRGVELGGLVHICTFYLFAQQSTFWPKVARWRTLKKVLIFGQNDTF